VLGRGDAPQVSTRNSVMVGMPDVVVRESLEEKVYVNVDQFSIDAVNGGAAHFEERHGKFDHKRFGGKIGQSPAEL